MKIFIRKVQVSESSTQLARASERHGMHKMYRYKHNMYKHERWTDAGRRCAAPAV